MKASVKGMNRIVPMLAALLMGAGATGLAEAQTAVVTHERTHVFGQQPNGSPLVASYYGQIVLSRPIGRATSEYQAYYSYDNGRSWSVRDLNSATERGYDPVIDLGNGEVLALSPRPHPHDGSIRKYRALRSFDGGGTWREEWAYMDQPLALREMTGDDRGKQKTAAYRFHHGIVRLRNGDLLACGFGNNTGDTARMDYPPSLPMLKRRLVVMNSSDKGTHWTNPRTIAYHEGPAQEGFNECDMVRARNGDIVLIVRTHNKINEFPDLPMTPMYMLRSRDEGGTWSAPKEIASFGGNPNLIALENGLLVAAYSGGPGGYFAISADNGETWQGETRLTANDSDTNLIATGPDTFLVFYYDGPNVLHGAEYRAQNASALPGMHN
jgi:hypothetical protein